LFLSRHGVAAAGGGELLLAHQATKQFVKPEDLAAMVLHFLANAYAYV
jgi:hypothetical protein